MAERDGRIDAVLSLRSGAIVADPFRPTAGLVAQLRCAAAQDQVELADAERAVRHRRRRGVAGRFVPRLAGGGA